MLPCHNLWDLEEERGRGFLNLSYGGKGIKKLPKELTTELLCLELTTISASCGVKRYMHYIRFLLTKTSSAKFESIFPLGSYFIYIIDFYQSANDS